MQESFIALLLSQYSDVQLKKEKQKDLDLNQRINVLK